MGDWVQLEAAMFEMSAIASASGVTVELDAADEELRTISLAVDLESADCADCVLPPDRLAALITGNLQRALGIDVLVTVDDARTGGIVAGSATSSGRSILVLDPCGVVPSVAQGDHVHRPTIESLAGRRVAFRVDVLWRSWDWTVEEWQRCLSGRGTTSASWRRAQGEAGETGRRSHARYEQFLAGADAAVVGLGNCGSCTAWTIKDALTARQLGLPTVAVVTAQFEVLARTVAHDFGCLDLPILVVPFPYDTLPESDVRCLARDSFDDLLVLLGITSCD